MRNNGWSLVYISYLVYETLQRFYFLSHFILNVVILCLAFIVENKNHRSHVDINFEGRKTTTDIIAKRQEKCESRSPVTKLDDI